MNAQSRVVDFRRCKCGATKDARHYRCDNCERSYRIEVDINLYKELFDWCIAGKRPGLRGLFRHMGA